MLDAVSGGTDAGEAEFLRRGADAFDDRGHRRVADRVEAGLEARLGAGHDMVGHGGGVQVGETGVVGVGVRLVQACGVGAEGAVDEQVSGGAERAELMRLGNAFVAPSAQ